MLPFVLSEVEGQAPGCALYLAGKSTRALIPASSPACVFSVQRAHINYLDRGLPTRRAWVAGINIHQRHHTVQMNNVLKHV
jgi:hypothetical protein